MKRAILFLITVILLFVISGCGTMGTFKGHNVTSVELSQANYNIVAKDLEGSASQGYLFGVSAPGYGSDVGIVGLIKVSGEDKPYAVAVKALWDNYRDKYGDPAGKKLALINIRQDTKVLNTLIYTEATLYLTADIVEFIK